MTELKKELRLYGLTMVAIGSCVGSGIFLTPSQVAGHLPSPVMILLVWGLGGVITLTGALTFAELGSQIKDKISHRAKALEAAREVILSRFSTNPVERG